MSTMRVDEKLAVNSFSIDQDVHVTIKEEICQSCDHRACLYACPAKLYTLNNGRIAYAYEGCLECGTCRVVCDKGSVSWDLPRGGFGVCFEYG